MENKHKEMLDELKFAGKEQIALLKVATDESKEEITKKSKEEMTKMQQQIDEASTRITLSNTMDANGRMALRTEMSSLQGRMATTNDHIEEMTPKISEIQAQIQEVMPKLVTMESNTENEQNSRAEFLEKMKALKTSVAEMVTTAAANNAPEGSPTVETVEKENMRYDGFEDASTGRRTIVDTDMDREKYRKKGWDRVFMTYNELEAIQWMNAQQQFTPKSTPIDTNAKFDSTTDEEATRSDESPYKDHDPRAKNYKLQWTTG
jgi:hypothetical protein